MVEKLFNEYTFLLWWIALMAVVARFIDVTSTVDVLGRKERRVNLLFAVAVFFPIFRLAAFGPIIADTYGYVRAYEKLTASFSDIGRMIQAHKSGFGFDIIEKLMVLLFGNNRRVFRVCIGVIHSIPVVLILRRYSEDYILSVFLFIASAFHIGWMMNGIRQYVAIVIIFLAFPLLLKKRYIPLILVILLAATIHTSALVMLPVVFVVQGKAWNWKTVLSLFAAIAAMYIFSRNVQLFDVMLVNTEYEGAIQTYRAAGDDGSNPIRILISAAPMILAFIGRKQLQEVNDPVITVCTNMSVITVSFYMIASVTSGIMVGRIPGYTNLYNLILIPSLVKHVFSRDSARIMIVLIVVLYLAYYFYEMQ